jgi:CheY-like chemotaxis protein
MPRILVVEDHEALRYAIARHLTAEGFDVVEAADTMAALAHLRSGIDIVLADVKMPPGNPHGVALVLMARRHSPGIRALLMTGYREAIEGEQLPCGVIYKPLDLQELSSALRTLMSAEGSA